MTQLEIYKKFEQKAKSIFKIVGDPSWFNSLIFELNETDYFQIGLEQEDEDVFCFIHIENEEVKELRNSRKQENLYSWLNKINEANQTKH